MSDFSNELVNNVLVVVRSSNERTEILCTELAKQQVPPEHVVTIHESPFSQALKKSFELGLDFGLDWTFCLDADVLLRRNAIRNLTNWMQTQPETTCVIIAQLLDKLLASPRLVGNNFYRTSSLTTALEYIESSTNQIRPESFIRQHMANRGFPFSLIKSEALGLHDFEQYYRDVYRKAMVHSRKYTSWVDQYAEDIWKRCGPEDMDYQVALWGYRAGLIYDGEITIDIKKFPHDIETLLRQVNTTEKAPLASALWSSAKVDDIIAHTSLPPEYVQWERLQNLKKRRGGMKRYIFEQIGPIKGTLWAAGKGMQRIGGILEQMAEKSRK